VALDRWRRLLPAVWLGFLLCVALIAAPAAFAMLPRPDAGRVVGWIFAREAAVSLALGALALLLERAAARRGGSRQFTVGLGLALGALFCTVGGHYALLPMIDVARAGSGPLTFGQLHAISVAFFGLKAVLVGALAWRAAGVSPAPSS
jgi:hypothetical protein